MKRSVFIMTVVVLSCGSLIQASDKKLISQHEARGSGKTTLQASASFEASRQDLAASCESVEGRKLVGVGNPQTTWDSNITSGSLQYVIRQNFYCDTSKQAERQQARLGN